MGGWGVGVGVRVGGYSLLRAKVVLPIPLGVMSFCPPAPDSPSSIWHMEMVTLGSLVVCMFE